MGHDRHDRSPTAPLLQRARTKAGLSDFGDPGSLRRASLFLESCSSTGRLHEAGRQVVEKVVLRHLINRLLLEDHVRRHPGIDSGPLPVALVITGLPRTGTTLLHGVLATDPTNRVLRLWEALRPLPPEADGPFSRTSLVGQAQTWLERLYELAPALRMVHEGTAEGPEECDALLQNDFASQHLEDMVRVDAYSRWLDHAPLLDAYRSFARQLRILGGLDGTAGWVLKSPSHLGHLDDLVTAFPGALVVHCHRRPVEAVASYASLIAAVRRPHSDHVDLAAVGGHALERSAVSMERALTVRRSMSPDRLLDVAFPSLCRDPLGVVTEIYHRLGRNLPGDVERGIRRWLEDHPRHRHGVHRYSPSTAHLDTEQLNRRFAPYMERFGDVLAR